MAINLDSSKTQHITCRRGDTFSMSLAFKQADGTTPLDLTGIIIRMHVKYFSTLVLSFSSLALEGINVPIPTNGVIELIKSKEDMNGIAPNKYKYDLEFTYPSGSRLTILAGDFIVNEDYTR